MKVLLILPSCPCEENKNGINKIVYNHIKNSDDIEYDYVYIGEEFCRDCPPYPIFSNVKSTKYIKVKNFSNLRSLFYPGTKEEQISKANSKEIINYINDNSYNYRALHFFSSRFSLIVDEIKHDNILLSLIDNKEIYYNRKIKKTGLLSSFFCRYQLKKISKVYEKISKYNLKYHFVSKLDARYFTLKYGCPSICIENGVDIVKNDVVREVNIDKGPTEKLVIFHGNFSYEPNIDAFNEIKRIATNMPEVSFLIFGRNSLTLDCELQNVNIVGEVEDLNKYLGPGKVYIAPLRLGSGIKNKVLEAMSFGMVVVGYKSAFDSLGRVKEDHFIVEEHNIEEYILKALELVSNNHELAQNITSKIIKNYSWKDKSEKFYQVYNG
ncbi:glycosyltransferase [Vibrio gigantis]|uniref:glycosyltransferase n=1 Tax=Vibrio gigantis TaxID=296199 RepID=UPI0035A6BB47